MGKTSIEWTDASWNPIVGCTEVSPGCANCYAARLASTRLKNSPAYKGLALHADMMDDPTKPRWNGVVRFLPERLEEPLHWRKPKKIFVCDMGDLFHESVNDEMLCKVWSMMNRNTHHTFQVLTKRPKLMQRFLSRGKNWEGWITLDGGVPAGYGGNARIIGSNDRWPLPNVWLGVSVENQHFADERIPLLLATPAAVRWISAEPLLGRVDIAKWLPHGWRYEGLNWVVCGGESGPNARPMHPDRARALRDQCVAAGVPFFFKQWGEWLPFEQPTEANLLRISKNVRENNIGDQRFQRIDKKKAGRLLDGREWNEYPA